MLLVGQEGIVASIECLLFEHDPIGIVLDTGSEDFGALQVALYERDGVMLSFETNSDEYRPEAETIVLRLPEANNEDDARTIVWEEFTRWFGPELAGPQSRYEQIARGVWNLWTSRDRS